MHPGNLDEAVGGVREGEAEPHAGAWEPAPPLANMVTLTAKAIGGKKLKTRRASAKRGILGGKRTVAMWKVVGDNTYLIEVRAGEHVQRMHLAEDTLDAIEELRGAHKGQHLWRMVYRVASSRPDTSAQQQPGEDINPEHDGEKR